MRAWTVLGFPPLHSMAPLMARMVAPKPWLTTGRTLVIQNHKAVLKETATSVATVSGEFSKSILMLVPAAP